MLRQDYILREIERIVEFALRALNLRQSHQPEDFLHFLEENCSDLTGLDYHTLLQAPSSQIVSLFYNEDGRNIGKLVASGTLLAEAADLHRRNGLDDQARTLFVRAAEILAFSTAQFNGEAGQSIAERLKPLRDQIANYGFPPEIHHRLEALCNTVPKNTE